MGLTSRSNDATAGIHFAVGQTAGFVQEHGRGDQNAGAASEGAEPVQLLGEVRHEIGRAAAARQTDDGGRSLLTADLNVRFETEQPIRGLPVIAADLAAADDTVDVVARRVGEQGRARKYARKRSAVARAAPAIANVAADIKSAPVETRIDHRRRLGVGSWREFSCECAGGQQGRNRRNAGENPLLGCRRACKKDRRTEWRRTAKARREDLHRCRRLRGVFEFADRQTPVA